MVSVPTTNTICVWVPSLGEVNPMKVPFEAHSTTSQMFGEWIGFRWDVGGTDQVRICLSTLGTVTREQGAVVCAIWGRIHGPTNLVAPTIDINWVIALWPKMLQKKGKVGVCRVVVGGDVRVAIPQYVSPRNFTITLMNLLPKKQPCTTHLL